MMEGLPSYDRFLGPISWEDARVGLPEMAECLETIDKSNSMPNFLIHGPPGTGKTSTMVAFAHHIYGRYFQSMVLQLNASDDRGAATLRACIEAFCGSYAVPGSPRPLRWVILDEADSLTPEAQQVLQTAIDRFRNTARFCILCNFVSRIHPKIRSRCIGLAFSPITRPQLAAVVRRRLEQVHKNLPESTIDRLLEQAPGDIRTILQNLYMEFVWEGHSPAPTPPLDAPPDAWKALCQQYANGQNMPPIENPKWAPDIALLRMARAPAAR